jgi:endonuclease/exonuclease/phosphatase family metal-dependent hydrolase
LPEITKSVVLVAALLALLESAAGAVDPGFSHDSPWASPGACRKNSKSGGRGRARTGIARIATWNLRWFPDGRAGKPEPDGGTDLGWMACVMARLEAPVWAVQEVTQTLRGRRAVLDLLDLLDRHTAGKWRADFDDCPDDGRQHVGFLYDTSRVKVTALRTLPSLNPLAGGCRSRLRPGVAAYLRFPGGADFHLLNLHLDSGRTGRDFRNRRESWSRLRSAVAGLDAVAPDVDVVVAGDFNTMGCGQCRPTITAEEEIEKLRRALSPGPAGLKLLGLSQPCTGYYRGRGTALDHVLVSASMQEVPRDARARVGGVCGALACAPARGKGLKALSRLSDHCPVVLEFLDRDRD